MKILHINGRIIAAVYDVNWFSYDDRSNGAAIVEVDEVGINNKTVCAEVIRYLNRVDASGLGKYYMDAGELHVRDGWVEYVESQY